MDRNQSIGLLLMFGLLAVYFIFFAPEPKIEEQNTTTSTVLTDSSTSNVQEKSKPINLPDSVQNLMNQQKYGVFASAVSVTEKELVIENEDLLIVFSNLGGKIKSVSLKNFNDYKADKGGILKIVDGEQSKMDFIFELPDKDLNLSDLGFSSSQTNVNDTTVITFSLAGNEIVLNHKYAIPPSGFEIFHEITGENLPVSMKRSNVKLSWNHGVTRAEERINDERNNTNVRFYSDGFDELKEQTNDFVEETISTPLKWISFKQKFFNVGVISKDNFKSAYVSGKGNELDSSVVKQLNMQVQLGKAMESNQYALKYYFGSNEYHSLKNVAESYGENLDMGWGPLPLVNKFLIIPIFNFLQKFLTNYGIIILILVIIIRLILAPLTYKSHMSMARMKVIKPELDEIKEKNKDEPQKAQQAQMKLYQQMGINPVSGCVPMLLQMPILFSLFYFFPNAVDLRQKSFLWANDLSTYDSLIQLPFGGSFDHLSLFTLLMTVSTLLYTWSNNQLSSAAMQGPTKNLQYIMPLVFFFVLNSYAAGLTFYYFISNMFSFGQMTLFRRLVDEDKIKAKLEENRKKNANKKKSGFQQRLEEAMKASQQNQQKKKKK